MENRIERLVKLSEYATSIGLSIDHLILKDSIALQTQIESLIKCKLALFEMEHTPTYQLLVNVYIVENLGPFNGLQAVPAYELEAEGYDPIKLEEGGAITLYMEKGEMGMFVGGGFENGEGSCSRIEKRFVKEI